MAIETAKLVNKNAIKREENKKEYIFLSMINQSFFKKTKILIKARLSAVLQNI